MWASDCTPKALLFYARLDEETDPLNGGRLFRASDLRHWLSLVGVFDVGLREDGTPMQESDYPLEEVAIDH